MPPRGLSRSHIGATGRALPVDHASPPPPPSSPSVASPPEHAMVSVHCGTSIASGWSKYSPEESRDYEERRRRAEERYDAANRQARGIAAARVVAYAGRVGRGPARDATRLLWEVASPGQGPAGTVTGTGTSPTGNGSAGIFAAAVPLRLCPATSRETEPAAPPPPPQSPEVGQNPNPRQAYEEALAAATQPGAPRVQGACNKLQCLHPAPLAPRQPRPRRTTPGTACARGRAWGSVPSNAPVGVAFQGQKLDHTRGHF